MEILAAGISPLIERVFKSQAKTDFLKHTRERNGQNQVDFLALKKSFDPRQTAIFDFTDILADKWLSDYETIERQAIAGPTASSDAVGSTRYTRWQDLLALADFRERSYHRDGIIYCSEADIKVALANPNDNPTDLQQKLETSRWQLWNDRFPNQTPTEEVITSRLKLDIMGTPNIHFRTPVLANSSYMPQYPQTRSLATHIAWIFAQG